MLGFYYDFGDGKPENVTCQHITKVVSMTWV